MASDSQQRRGPWSEAEDGLLMRLVCQQEQKNWVNISSELATRSPKQCRERYHQNLKPSLNHNPITVEEGRTIERLVEARGKKWAEIARVLDNRSDNAVKNWWNGHQNRRKRMSRRRASSQEVAAPHHAVINDSPYHPATIPPHHHSHPSQGLLTPPGPSRIGRHSPQSPMNYQSPQAYQSQHSYQPSHSYQSQHSYPSQQSSPYYSHHSPGYQSSYTPYAHYSPGSSLPSPTTESITSDPGQNYDISPTRQSFPHYAPPHPPVALAPLTTSRDTISQSTRLPGCDALSAGPGQAYTNPNTSLPGSPGSPTSPSRRMSVPRVYDAPGDLLTAPGTPDNAHKRQHSRTHNGPEGSAVPQRRNPLDMILN